ncbi:hypothetical protein FRX94_11050 [Corynebacterium canis]|uniref:Uncharacterized protein n=1 Tax=Corynebacterium canis TaxID=679663 RepID=A0A5C5UAB7_9CORY|nr:DUF6474 family protein [Corynebacterium canis]TWT22743.1 hypothetical protein FRX94_11050 [Corynebacterium canis]WJY76461.1 hypothetical protein CCANI_13280 [Corynebacterium canis]
MGIFEAIRKSRARTKAEIKAAKVKAKEEVRQTAKLEARRSKLLAAQEKALLRAERRGLKAKRKHEQAMAKTTLAQMRAGRFNKATLLRYSAATRVLVPVLIPLAYRAITFGREQLLSMKAQRLGVTAHELAQYSGHGAPLKARIAGIRKSLENSKLPAGFVRDVNERLEQLDSAVDNSEYMTAEQRRRVHRSTSKDLDLLLQEVQQKIESA